MNLEELRKDARRRLDDQAAPFLWSNEELDSYINNAEAEAATRAKLLYDTTTPRVVEIALRQGVPEYALCADVIRIDYIILGSTGRKLRRCYQQDLEEADGRWTISTGRPEAFFEQEKSIRVYRIPETADLLRLALWRLPLNKLQANSDVPEIAERHHRKLFDWVCHEAYTRRDSDTYDPEKAAAHEAAFTASFGISETADVYRKRRLRRPTVVKARW